MKKLSCLIILNILFIAVAGVFYFKYYNRNETNTFTSIATPVTTAGNEVEQENSPLKTAGNEVEQGNSPHKASVNEIEQENLPLTTAGNEPEQRNSPLKDNEKTAIKVSATPKIVHNTTSDNKTRTDKTPKANKPASDNSNIKENAANKNEIIEKKGLVELIKLDDSFVIDIKYATTDNFTKKKIYTMPMCLIHKKTAQKLINANNDLKTLGYRIKVFDAYRPYSTQQVLWDAAADKSFVANPKKGSIHNRGAAVDVTLVDKDEKEIGMPSAYDEFSERAYLKYTACDQQLIKNRELLGKYMVKHGFKRISNEWWHFEDINAKEYPILDIAFEEFVQAN